MFETGDLLINLFIYLYGLLWALVMASAEGPIGWGTQAHQWKIQSNHWLAKIFKIINGGRPLHLLPMFAVTTFIISFLFLPLWNYAHGLPFTLINWGELITYSVIFIWAEDFYWFLVNPYYGLSKFKKEFIPWHPNWFFRIPTDYLIALLIVIIVGLLSRGYFWLLVTLSIQGVLTGLTIIFSLLYLPKIFKNINHQ